MWNAVRSLFSILDDTEPCGEDGGDIWKFLGFGERSVIGHTGVRLGDCPRPIDRGFAALLPQRCLRAVDAVTATARSRGPEEDLQVQTCQLGEWPAAEENLLCSLLPP